MIIDLILDRQQDELEIQQGYTHKQMFNGELISLEYSPYKFYSKVLEYYSIFPKIAAKILDAMDYGNEEDVKKALCNYIVTQEYNMQICDFINSVNWI